jgi:hypothetical protein
MNVSVRRWQRLFATTFVVLLSACGDSSALLAPNPIPRAEGVNSGPICAPPAPGQPMLVTEDCQDPRFNDPYLFVDTTVPALNALVRGVPIPYTVVRGGFRGTDVAFAFYFPQAGTYQGRSIQGPIHQLRLTGDVASLDEIQFAFESGAYMIQVNPGNEGSLNAREAIAGKNDPAIMGYRLNAAATKFSRVMARQVYGLGDDHRPHSYIYGGSGGAYMTLSAAENSIGVWDGFVPFVMGHPLAIPDHFTVRINALRILRQRPEVFPCIADAYEPAGGHDPYTSCNLTEEEAGALREATLLGFPPRGWFQHAGLQGGPLLLVADYVGLLDPTYAQDFWTKPGYLGHDDPYGSMAKARIQVPATVVAVTPYLVPDPLPPTLPADLLFGPGYVGYQLAGYLAGVPPRAFLLDTPVPEGDLTGTDLVVTSGPSSGRRFPLQVVNAALGLVVAGANSDPVAVAGVGIGDTVRIDNSYYLALQTHHRHQTPGPWYAPVRGWSAEARELVGWNQFLDASDQPIYPLRDVFVGPNGGYNGAGSVQTGRYHGKVIVVNTMLDIDALPYPADWYLKKARKHKEGELGEDLDDSFRVWFVDNADHSGVVNAHQVQYAGVLQQALRDVAAWAEEGVPPAPSSQYELGEGAQIVIPTTDANRGGIQPVVELTANGGILAEVAVGEPVSFAAVVGIPPGTGELVQTEWDFEGVGYGDQDSGLPVPTPDPGDAGGGVVNPAPPSKELTQTLVYSAPGTYFAGIRVTTQRDPSLTYARVQNLARVRVVVR